VIRASETKPDLIEDPLANTEGTSSFLATRFLGFSCCLRILRPTRFPNSLFPTLHNASQLHRTTMTPDSEMSDAAVPSDAILEKTLRDIVRTAEVNPITIKTLRATAENRLGLDAGFFKNSAEWSTKSKDIIEDEFVSLNI